MTLKYLPAIEYDPSEFLDRLRQASKPFAEFYKNEIEPINATIRWFRDPNLPPGRFGYTNVYEHGRVANIFLAQMPPLKQDVFVLAHELASLVIYYKGYWEDWNIQCKNHMVRIVLLDMIATPLRDSILAKYGFDVEGELNNKIDSLMNNSDCIEPSESVHVFALDYVWLTLYWQDVLGNHGVPPTLDNWYKRCRPTAQKQGRCILAIVDDVGYSTSEKALTLFQRIIAEYNLDCDIHTSK